ncbi:hypothetical protein [Zooshikella ganghwensis]|uniref:Uncharacterized protein n=1 Tax=Zooshikella ganghwensis TaxID=202772 RepID=A0A4P9VPN1_9GAMM|nr:hypothetical protein [Zooshikella ganghwensis]RDH44080.1 hypothetical protein B9G39_11820 [Zooshikella ganghwensis]
MKKLAIYVILSTAFIISGWKPGSVQAAECKPLPADDRVNHLLYDALFIANIRFYVTIGDESKSKEILDNEVALMVSFLNDIKVRNYCGVSAEQISLINKALRYIAAINSIRKIEEISNNKTLSEALDKAVLENKLDYEKKLEDLKYLLYKSKKE